MSWNINGTGLVREVRKKVQEETCYEQRQGELDTANEAQFTAAKIGVLAQLNHLPAEYWVDVQAFGHADKAPGTSSNMEIRIRSAARDPNAHLEETAREPELTGAKTW